MNDFISINLIPEWLYFFWATGLYFVMWVMTGGGL